MKKGKKLLSALLAAAMVFGLAGCGNSADTGNKEGSAENKGQNSGLESGEQKETTKGRFIESELKLPDGISEVQAIQKLSDGSLEAVGCNEQTNTHYILTSTDEGENWQVKELEALQSSYWSNVAISNDGTIAVLGIYSENGSQEADDSDSTELCLISKNGEVRKVDFVLPEKEDKSSTDTVYNMLFQEQSENSDNAEDTVVQESTENIKVTDGAEVPTEGEATEDGGVFQYTDMVENMVLQAAFDQEGNLIVQDLYSTCYKIDIQSGELTQLYEKSEMDLFYFGIAGNRVYGIAESGMEIFSSIDGTLASQDSVLDDVAKANAQGSATPGYLPVVMTKGMEENSVVYANHQGVFYHQENGSVTEQLINGELCSLSDTTLMLSGIIMLNEKSYLISAMNSIGNVKLLKYVYDENASSVPEKQLRVYALEESSLLRQIVANFQSAHPDTFVKVEIGVSEENGITVEDALRTLNTDILAGKGPDILILDGMPAESYKNKGILADIKGILGEIDKTEGLFANIKSNYEENDSIYYLPSRFSIPAVEGSDEAAAAGSTEALLSYAEGIKKEGICVFPSSGATGMLKELFQADSAGWLTKEGTIDESKLKNYLQTAKGMYDLDKSDRTQDNDGSFFSYDLLGYNLGTLSGAVSGRMMKTNQISIGTISGLEDLRNILSMEKEMGGIYDIYAKQEVKSFVPYLMAGIVSGSEEKQEVVEFIQMIYGKECQMLSSSGFPVNKAAYQAVYEKMGEDDLEESGVAFSTEEGIMGGYQIIPLTQEAFDSMTQKIESLNAPCITDRIVCDLVLEEGSKYLKDEQSLEDAVAAVMQKINIYLSE